MPPDVAPVSQDGRPLNDLHKAPLAIGSGGGRLVTLPCAADHMAVSFAMELRHRLLRDRPFVDWRQYELTRLTDEEIQKLPIDRLALVVLKHFDDSREWNTHNLLNWVSSLELVVRGEVVRGRWGRLRDRWQ